MALSEQTNSFDPAWFVYIEFVFGGLHQQAVILQKMCVFVTVVPMQ
jgi:hypothetical protein